MSHYATLVVVNDAATADHAIEIAEDMLAPYDENREVGHYFRPESPEGVMSAIEVYSEGTDSTPPPPDTPEYRDWVKAAVGYYGGMSPDAGVYNEQTDEYGVMSTHNPDAKWDWYVLGGRWQGSFLVKEQVKVLANSDGVSAGPVLGEDPAFGGYPPEAQKGRADVAQKQDIDFDQMVTLAVLEAERNYDKFEKATEGLAVPPPFEKMLRNNGAGSPDENPEYRSVLDRTREQFRQWKWVKAVSEITPLFSNPHEYWAVEVGGRGKFIERARKSAFFAPYAILDAENGWNAVGEMGWFGMSSDTQADRDDWGARMEEYIESLPGHSWLLVYDLHI